MYMDLMDTIQNITAQNITQNNSNNITTNNNNKIVQVNNQIKIFPFGSEDLSHLSSSEPEYIQIIEEWYYPMIIM